MADISKIVNLFFQLFMIFIVLYSGIAIFVLLKFGQSRILGFLVASFYIFLVGSLYFQTLGLINQL